MDGLSIDEASKALPESVEVMVQKVMYPMTRAEAEELEETLGRHLAVFQKKEEPLGRTDLVRHRIETGGARPMKQGARRLPLLMRDEASKQVAQMSKDGLIKQSTSPWMSQVVLVKKKDGSVRF